MKNMEGLKDMGVVGDDYLWKTPGCGALRGFYAGLGDSSY